MRVASKVLVAGLFVAGCTSAVDRPLAQPDPTFATPATVPTTAQTRTSEAAPVFEVMKECPVSSLTTVVAIVEVSPAGTFEEVHMSESDRSLLADVRVDRVVWARPEVDVAEGDPLIGMFYLDDTVRQDAEIDEWLAGGAPRLVTLYPTSFRQFTAPFELWPISGIGSSTLDFRGTCVQDRFAQLAALAQRPAELDLYVELLAEHEAWLECGRSSTSCVPGPVLAVGFAIDESLPGM